MWASSVFVFRGGKLEGFSVFFPYFFSLFFLYFFEIRKYNEIYFVLVVHSVLHNQVLQPQLLWEKETEKKKKQV